MPADCPEGLCPAYTLVDPVQMCGDAEGGLYVLSDEGTFTDPTFGLNELSISLLALQGPIGPGDPWSATLAVTEQQALSLIGAQSAGREIRLLPRP